MMFGVLDYLKIGSGAVMGALLVSAPIYLYGKHEGRQQAAVAALEASVKAIHERTNIDEAISTADAVDLCRDLGLSVDEATECVRRLEAAQTQP